MIVTNIDIYDGSILHNRFAYRYFKEDVNPLGDIIAFRAPMRVEADHMIDQQDLLNRDFIYSDDAINFMWEIPNMNAFGAVAYQRLFNRHITEILSDNFLGKKAIVDGDDTIIEGEGKCSVSITYVNDNAALGHTGINIYAGDKAPDFAYSTKLTDQQAKAFMQQVIAKFYEINQSIFIATTKVTI